MDTVFILVFTRGVLVKIDPADRTPRETLEERLEKTPSNARCFAQGFYLMCWSIIESLMGTAHGADELGLCSHGLSCQAGTWGCYIGLCLRYGHIWTKIKSGPASKIFCKALWFVPCWRRHFDKRIFACKTWDAADADRAVARLNRATRARPIGTYLRAQFISVYL